MKKTINIKTDNQRGGITAGEINTNVQPKKHGFWHKPINKYIIFPIIVGLILYYITNRDMVDNIFNVTSNNQHGGITAGQINIGPQQRTINNNFKDQLEKFRNKKIIVQAISGDAEAEKFAYEIKDYLESNGFNFASFAHIILGGPAKGQSYQEKDGVVTITIGHNNQ